MSPETQTLQFTRMVNASPAAAYHLFTDAVGIQGWLCDRVETDPKVGGRMYLWWQSGYYVSGVFTALEKHHLVSFTWLGRDEPGATNVQITFEIKNGGTEITLVHTGISAGESWAGVREEFMRGWEKGLDNLQSVLETGQDLRFVRRPMLGIMPSEFLDEEEAAEIGLPIKGGLRIAGVVEGMGADLAGLIKGDVVIQIGETPVTDWDLYSTVLDGHFAGDVVEVKLYREGVVHTVPMELSSRPLPEVPQSPLELSALIEKIYDEMNENLIGVLKGVLDEHAEYKPSPEIWSAKDILAHLIHTERDTQKWIAAELNDEQVNYVSNTDARIQATVIVYPSLVDLLSEFQRTQQETIAFVGAIPESFVGQRKASYMRLGYSLIDLPYHTSAHLEQIQISIEVAKKSLT